MSVSELVRPMPTRTARPTPALDEFSDDLFDSLQHSDQRRWARTYLRGLVSVPGRKSIRRISEMLTTGEADQCLQQFVNQSPWDWRPVRRALAHRLTGDAGPHAWIVDEAAIPKNGSQSVGVARQYVPAAGRVQNCQLGAFVSLASPAGSTPVNWRLQLPGSWDSDALRRRRTGVPAGEMHRARWGHALDMIDEMVQEWGLRPPPLLADLSRTRALDAVLQSLDARRLRYVVRVPVDTAVGRGVRLSTLTHPATGRGGLSVHDGRGTGSPPFTSAPLPEQAATAGVLCPRTILTRWRRGPAGEPEAVFLTNVAERLPHLVETVRMWDGGVASHRRMHEESGLDHFEGRSFRGWHHHVTLVSAAHAHRLAHADAARLPAERVG